MEDSEASQILFSLIEQIRNEMGGTGGAISPDRIFVDGDKAGINEIIFQECLVEEAVDKQTEFPYQEFLCMLHKRIRAKKENS